MFALDAALRSSHADAPLIPEHFASALESGANFPRAEAEESSDMIVRMPWKEGPWHSFSFTTKATCSRF
jgi:hypothetical protein